MQKQLGAAGAVLAKRQAALDLEFLPKEQGIRAEQLQLNTERADLALRQAALGAVEANKQQQLAKLSRDTLQLNLGSARDQLEALLIQKQEREEGFVDEDRLNKLRERQERHAIQAAQLAVKRAEIEAKFPHLEEQKADLAAEQAQIAIRSAEIEKRDASLKLAKDKAGQPIERSLAALRYQQATLDEAKALTTLNESQLEVLQQILQQLGGRRQEQVKVVRDEQGNIVTDDRTGGAQLRGAIERLEQAANKSEEKKKAEEPSGGKPGETFSTGTPLTGQKTFRIDESGNVVDTTGVRQPQPLQPQPPAQPPQPITLAPADIVKPVELTAADVVKAVELKPEDVVKQAEAATPNTDALQGLATAADTAKTALEGIGSSAGNAQTAFDNAGTAAQRLANALLDAANAATGQRGNINKDTITAATGGLIRGAGTGTSDSIPAMLSHGEFVQSARAVKFYGPAFMDALNQIRLPKLPGFNIGGMVGLLSPQTPRLNMPHYAEGGMVDARPQTTTTVNVDLRTEHGRFALTGDVDVVARLQRAAVAKRITSTGRKPGFIG